MAALEGLARRVVLTGSECTGKTTLTADLARHYHVVWVPEYVRSYAAWKAGAPLNLSGLGWVITRYVIGLAVWVRR